MLSDAFALAAHQFAGLLSLALRQPDLRAVAIPVSKIYVVEELVLARVLVLDLLDKAGAVNGVANDIANDERGDGIDWLALTILRHLLSFLHRAYTYNRDI